MAPPAARRARAARLGPLVVARGGRFCGIVALVIHAGRRGPGELGVRRKCGVLVVEVGLRALLIEIIAAVVAMKEHGGGGIVNVSSIVGEFPDPGGGAYAATKAAVDLLSRTAYRELRDHGVHVVNVKPALTDTDFSAVSRNAPGRRVGGARPAKVARWVGDALAPGAPTAGRVVVVSAAWP